MYDITNAQSFDNLEDWLAIIKKTCGQKLPALALVGNKSKSRAISETSIRDESFDPISSY